MTRFAFAALAAVAVLAGCASPEIRYGAATPPPSSDRVSIRYDRIALEEVTLPAYALTEEIQREGPDGAIRSTGFLWADEPARGVGLQLGRDLSALTGAIVAPEPWPYRDGPDLRVDLRIERFLATEGAFEIAGQFFVAADAMSAPDRAERFAIVVPLVQEGPVGITRAQASAVTALAKRIAEEGLR